ncbi:amidohydrolase family protein [Acinetobacter sp. R933-2]|uniref:amidohydrolase family protein n=1 Tax=Acinetobacter sp. R933-2 TaxID=2746728 RepID=UPI0025757D9D|nr:amidohydrolase family protein [Acinetobacter sp. R933-2]MDM1246418.1 amidohydrolase family protein [Acinetobacter sp. R933-2]
MFAVDTHAHVFSKNDPCIATARYTPDYDASVSEYIAHLDQHQLTHGVLVQPSFFGTDNRVMLQAIAQYPDRLKGIAVVDHVIHINELILLNQQGIVGIRLNLFGKNLPNFSDKAWNTLFNHLSFMNWQVELHAPPAYLVQILPILRSYQLNVVIDHFGRIDPIKGIQDPDYQDFLNMLDVNQHWIKVSAFYRLGQSPENIDVASQAFALLKAKGFLHKLVWGSDWPNTQHESKVSYASVVEAFHKIVPDEQERQQILGQNAQNLYAFETKHDSI